MLDYLNPDLVILDVDDTSSITGLELCHIVRQDPSWSNLPIILLSDRADRMMLQQVFAAGAYSHNFGRQLHLTSAPSHSQLRQGENRQV
jgi:CheY-like chemotaxis protein